MKLPCLTHDPTQLSALIVAALLFGCADDSKSNEDRSGSGGATQRTQTSTGTTVTAGGNGGGGGGTTNTSAPTIPVASGCQPWPASKFGFLTGPFFYGPDPGPCSLTYVYQETTYVQTFVYDDEGRPVSSDLVYSDDRGNTTETYSYEAGRLVTVSVNGTPMTTYSYSGDGATVTMKGTSYSGVWSLDPLGYPQQLTVTIVRDSVTTTEQYIYQYDGCRLVGRVGPSPANPTSPMADWAFSYDAEGHLTAMTGVNGLSFTYDYSCW